MTDAINKNPFSEKIQGRLDQSLHTSRVLQSQFAIPSGQDGYRTPTIEDYHQHVNQTQRYRRPEVLSTTSSFNRLPSSAMSSGYKDALNLTTKIDKLETLEWRERIRHFTWTFFTMTMATGGIANLLYAGKAFSQRLFSMNRRLIARQYPFVFEALKLLVSFFSF